MEAWRLKMEAWRLKMEAWRVYRPVVEDSQHFDEEQDPDPPYNEIWIEIRIKLKSLIRIRIEEESKE